MSRSSSAAKIAAAAGIIGLVTASAACSSTSATRPVDESPAGVTASATQSPTPTPRSTVGAGLKACEVTDELGVADLGVNAATWQGMEQAQYDLGIQTALFESTSESDYGRNFKKAMNADCDLIVSVGFLMADATTQAAAANRQQKFSIVDPELSKDAKPKGQLLQQTFATRQAAFLAGYLAAGMSKTGTVGTFGGVPVAASIQMMAGFRKGVLKFNDDNNASVQVLGWDGAAGRFTNDFYDTGKAADATRALMSKGADVVFTAAGIAGAGAAQVAAEVGTDQLMIIGSDFDQYLADPAHASAYLTSVMKNVDVTTRLAIRQVVDGSFKKGVLVGTLDNGGVGLAPFHDFQAQVPAELASQLDGITAGITSGEITVD